MGKLTGGQLMAKALKKEGVTVTFGLSGGHIMPIFYGCREEGIKVIDTRHECTAGYAADAYARVSGNPGVLITTAGPGVTDTFTAMAEAADSGTPLIHIGGAAQGYLNDTGTAQDVDTVTAMRTFCRFSKICRTGERIPEYVSMAFRHALDDTPGPVYLEVPRDILTAEYDEESIYWPEHYRTDTMAFGDPNAIRQAAELLAGAKRPVMVLGEQARYNTQYGENVAALVDYLKMPVYSLPLAVTRGVFADESKNELFLLGDAATAEADVILELNVNNLQHVNRGRAPLFNADAKIIQAHPDKTKIGYNTRADVGIVAGAGGCAMQLLEEVKKLRGPVTDESWVEQARQLTAKAREPFTKALTDEKQPPEPGRLAGEVAKFLNEVGQDWHVICDGGDAAQWILHSAVARYPGQVLKFGNFGTIGTGAGFTIGAWAATGKPVLYFSGDGSFGFYTMEFDTFVKQGIPVVSVISNDSAWGMIKLSQEIANEEYIQQHGHHSVNILAEMREYDKLPAIWGGVGVKINTWQEVVPALRKVWESGKPGIVNCEVDKKAYSPRTRSFAGKY